MIRAIGFLPKLTVVMAIKEPSSTQMQLYSLLVGLDCFAPFESDGFLFHKCVSPELLANS
jgi:hypothetical protein